MKLPAHKTKIVCTIGPASRHPEVLKDLILNGMNVARLNFSHADLAEHTENILRIRAAAESLNLPVAIMIDLPGPKIRIGKLQNQPLTLKKGEYVTLTTRNIPGSQIFIPVKYKQLPQSVSTGSSIYLNDGFIQLKVRNILKSDIYCEIIVGGQLLSNKGLNLPDANLSIDAITKRDFEFIDFGLKNGINIFAVSFVSSATDIIKIKKFAKKKGKKVYVIAKIERNEAVRNIDEITNAADAIMVARGDLGVQVPIEQVPMIQKNLIRKANIKGIPVITATQMLESMTQNLRPTRAEATDVANAIIDGTDAVMLSEETAIGKFPIQTVRMMASIAANTESKFADVLKFDMERYFENLPEFRKAPVEDILSMSVFEATQVSDIKLIAAVSAENMPRKISRFKPHCWIAAFHPDEKTREFFSFSAGVYPLAFKNNLKNPQKKIIDTLKKIGLSKKNEKLVLTFADSLQILAV
ncbi:MAG: Pyruvate kinase [Planctomycetes bacterium ADurb.Bin401]|nr:MAG: Pyruvate kinase [Planctomycetes bacterium ADurb.Bin401]